MRIKKNKKYGNRFKLSLARKAIIDFMYFSKTMSVNAVSAESYFQLDSLYQAKKTSSKNLSWYSIYIKAFGILSLKYPELRQSFFPIFLPHIFQYHLPSAMLAMERRMSGQTMVVYLKIDNPAVLELVEIEKRIKEAQRRPPDKIKSIRRFLKMMQLPFILRRMAWFLGLNFHGFKWRYFGTFGVTGIGRGVRSLNVKTPLPVTFIFDMSNEEKPLFRLYWDHRIFDGVIVSKMMQDLERILNGQIVAELMLK
jgi:hypothetical protein